MLQLMPLLEAEGKIFAQKPLISIAGGASLETSQMLPSAEMYAI